MAITNFNIKCLNVRANLLNVKHLYMYPVVGAREEPDEVEEVEELVEDVAGPSQDATEVAHREDPYNIDELPDPIGEIEEAEPLMDPIGEIAEDYIGGDLVQGDVRVGPGPVYFKWVLFAFAMGLV